MNARTLVLALALTACGREPIIPGPPPMKDPQPLAGCQGKSIVELDGATLERVAADGAVTPLFHLGDGRADSDVSVTDWQERNGFIAAEALLEGGPGGESFEFLLLDPRDAVVFHRITQQTYTAPLHLGSDGTLAVPEPSGWLVHPDGSVTDLGDLLPLEAPLPGGLLPVARGYPWDPASPKGLLALDTMTFTALSPKPDDSSDFQEAGGNLLYIAGGKLVLASSTGTQEIALPDSSWRPDRITNDRFVVLSGNYQFRVLDIATVIATPVTGLPEATNQAPVNVTVGDDGTVFSSVLENDLLQLRSTTDFGASWQNVGAPMPPGQNFGGGTRLSSVAHGSSVLIVSGSLGYGLFLNRLQLVPAGSPPQSLDLGGMYVNARVAADLSADGQCAATWAPSTDTAKPFDLHFIDTMHGDVKVQSAPEIRVFHF
jgi:hypothetical protein